MTLFQKLEVLDKFKNYQKEGIHPNDGAFFSDCRRYRYVLWRTWDKSKPLILFIGLNPSTANEQTDDPTIRRVKTFAKDWGFGGVLMMNLFAFITAYPKELINSDDPIGENDFYLEKLSECCKEIVFCWGAFDVVGRDKIVAKMFPEAKALVLNRKGSPRHPLYVPKDTKLVPFES